MQNKIDEEEYIKCKNDIIYFAEKYIIDFDGDITLFDYQKDALLRMFADRRLLLGWRRGKGKDLVLSIYAVHALIFGSGIGILWNTATFHQIRCIRDRLSLIIRRLPEKFKEGIVREKDDFIGSGSSLYIKCLDYEDIGDIYYYDAIICNDFNLYFEEDHYKQKVFYHVLNKYSENKYKVIVTGSRENIINDFTCLTDN